MQSILMGRMRVNRQFLITTSTLVPPVPSPTDYYLFFYIIDSDLWVNGIILPNCAHHWLISAESNNHIVCKIQIIGHPEYADI